MKNSIGLLALLISIRLSAQIPELIIQDWEQLIRDGGTWISTDNTGDYDAWGMQFSWGLGKKSLDLELYAIREDQNIGTLWTYKTYYHPGTGTVVLEQWGSDGAYGTGTIEYRENGRSENVSSIYFTEGHSITMKHEELLQGDEKTSQTFRKNEAGEWVKDKVYVWRRWKD